MLGTTIHNTRKELKLSLQELSNKSGVSTSHIARIERGERFPSAKVLCKILGSMGLSNAQALKLGGYLTGDDGDLLEQFIAQAHSNGDTNQEIAYRLLVRTKGLLL